MTETNPNLIPYRVMLHEEPGDKFQLVFECMAEDDDHAVEQAENAYPGCDIISYLPFDNSPLLYVIYSPNESAINDGAGFWSNRDGWTELDGASKFSHSEKQTLNLPVSTGQDAKWVLFDEARDYYGTASTDALDVFRHEVAICIDCMLQDDARGEAMVFVREGSRLTPKVVTPDAIDLDNLQQYEMILFDGGNSAGDTWKHTFFPKLLQHHFVDENPLPSRALTGNMMFSVDGDAAVQGCFVASEAEVKAGNSAAVQVFRGYLGYGGTQINVEFQAPVGATVAEKDVAFLAALAQQADMDYLAVGEGDRNIFQEAMEARFISTSVSPLEEIRIRRDLVAQEVLGGYPQDTIISREFYDADGLFGECLIWLNPHFEFPHWEGRTAGDFLIKHGIPGEPVCLNVLQHSTRQPNKDGVNAENVTLQELWDAQPLGESGWLLPSGLEVWFHKAANQH